MKSLEEISQLLSRQAPSNRLVSLLNETFGPLGWEYDGNILKVMSKVSEGHYLSVSRGYSGASLLSCVELFGLEVKDEPAKEAPVQASPAADSGPNRVGQGSGEPAPAVSTGTPRPSRKVILDSITECSRVILAKKLRTQDQLVKMVEAFAVKRKEELNQAQAEKLLEQLTEITKETK